MISIGIPAYNAEKYLGSTLESVLAQTFTSWEMVVVDDGAKDSTALIAQAFADRDDRIRLVRQANGGLAAARNRAFAEMCSSSEYVIFLDADDVWEPNALEVLANALAVSPEAVAAHGRSSFIDSNGAPLPDPFNLQSVRHHIVNRKIVRMDDRSPTTFASLVVDNNIATPGAVLIRRSALNAAGLWDGDPAIKGCEDYDMWLRLALLGPIAFVTHEVLRYRLHSSNMSGNGKMMRRSERAVRRKIHVLAKATPDRQLEMRIGYRRIERKYAWDKLNRGVDLCFKWKIRDGFMQILYGCAHFFRGLRGLPSPPRSSERSLGAG